MTARLVIDDAGAVVLAVSADSTIHSDRVEGCALSALRAVHFPPAPKGRFTDVLHRILFSMEAPPGLPSGDAGAAAFANRWITMSSEHFVLYTEGGLAVAQRALMEAERSYSALRTALSIHFDARADSRRLNIVVFSSAYLYRSFAPLTTSGVYRPAGSLGESDHVFLLGVGEFRVLQHELVHRLMHRVLPSAPAWLSEGLAQYHEWTEVEDDSITAGITPVIRAARRLSGDSPYVDPIQELIRRSRKDFYGPQRVGFYSSAFWLTTTLISDPVYRPRLNRYVRSLARGRTSEAAWKEAFGDIDPARLERDYQAEPARVVPVTYRVDWRPPAPLLSAPRALDYAAGHTLMASFCGASKQGDARRELDKAIELDPGQAEAYARRALLQPSPGLDPWADAMRATSMDPRLALGWVALGLNLLRSGDHQHKERMEEVTQRLLGFRDSADSQCVAAMLLAARGKLDAAVAGGARRGAPGTAVPPEPGGARQTGPAGRRGRIQPAPRPGPCAGARGHRPHGARRAPRDRHERHAGSSSPPKSRREMRGRRLDFLKAGVNSPDHPSGIRPGPSRSCRRDGQARRR